MVKTRLYLSAAPSWPKHFVWKKISIVLDFKRKQFWLVTGFFSVVKWVLHLKCSGNYLLLETNAKPWKKIRLRLKKLWILGKKARLSKLHSLSWKSISGRQVTKNVWIFIFLGFVINKYLDFGKKTVSLERKSEEFLRELVILPDWAEPVRKLSESSTAGWYIL